jgi:hypothetical protein
MFVTTSAWGSALAEGDLMAGAYFEIKKTDKGEYWWRLKDGNHKQYVGRARHT